MRWLFLLLLTACSGYEYKLRETNDYFTFFNKDSDYTQGLKLSAEAEGEAYSISQDIYTPIHKREDPPRANERPYAGYLSFSYAKSVTGSDNLWYAVTPGYIGPRALGEVAQCGIHAVLGQTCPVGWHHQLDNRPTLQGDVIKRWFIDNTRYETKASLGLPKSALSASFENSWSVGQARLFSGCELELLGYDAFLDNKQSTVRPRRYRATLRVGFQFSKYLYFLAVQTPAYKEQSSSYNYGGIEVTW